MSAGKELVGPLPTIWFGGGPGGFESKTRQVYKPPRDTLDIRHAACRDHHPACDCREAEVAEQLAEYRATRDMIRTAAQRVLRGHRVFDWGDDVSTGPTDPMFWSYVAGDGPLACQCSGCQLIRAAHEWPGVDPNGVIQ